MEMEIEKSIADCPLCITKQRKGSLVRYATSLDATVVLCSNDICCYIDGGRNSPVDMISSIFEPPDESIAVNLKQNNISSELDSLIVKPDIKPANSTITNSALHANLRDSTPDNHMTENMEPDVLRKPSITDDRYIMLWPNVDALCWLDVLLCAICHNQKISRRLDMLSVISKLVVAFDEAQLHISDLALHQTQWIYSVLDKERISIKLGGGDLLLDKFLTPQTPLENFDLNKARRKLRLSSIKLECAREEIWQTMETRMKCIRGKDDSPLFAFQALARDDKYLNELYATEYSWNMTCDSCGNVETTKHTSFIPTMPKVPSSDFSLSQPAYYIRDCFKCGESSQKRYMSISNWPVCLAMHFADGLVTCDMENLDFKVNVDGGYKQYRVSAVVSYKSHPNHFTVWQRKPTNDDRWMLYDDLQIHYLTYNLCKCCVKPQDVHIVFWECIKDTSSQTKSKADSKLSSCQPEQLNKMNAKITIDIPEQTNVLTNQTIHTSTVRVTSTPERKVEKKSPLPIPSVLARPKQNCKRGNTDSLPKTEPSRQPAIPVLPQQEFPIVDSQAQQKTITVAVKPAITSHSSASVPSPQITEPINLRDLVSNMDEVAEQAPATNGLKLKLFGPNKKLRLNTLTPLPTPKTSIVDIKVPFLSTISPSPILPSYNNSSYASILAQISAPKTGKSIQTSAPVHQPQKVQPPKQPKRSYLDIVKPLLERTKKLTSSEKGYIPRSERLQSIPEPDTKKHVMFSDDAKPSSPTISSARAKLRPRRTLEEILRKKPIVSNEKLPQAVSVAKVVQTYKKAPKRPYSFVSDEFELPKRFKPKDVSEQEALDMPDFDEMLSAFN